MRRKSANKACENLQALCMFTNVLGQRRWVSVCAGSAALAAQPGRGARSAPAKGREAAGDSAHLPAQVWLPFPQLYRRGPRAGAPAAEPTPGTSTRTPRLSRATAPRGAFPAPPPLCTSTLLSQGGAGHGDAHPHAPLALGLGVPLPLHAQVTYLFICIYLFIYLRFKLFIGIY